jgi:hypothetical protein
VSAAEALAEARQAYADQLAGNPEVDALAEAAAAHLEWLRENPDAVWTALTRE